MWRLRGWWRRLTWMTYAPSQAERDALLDLLRGTKPKGAAHTGLQPATNPFPTRP